MINRMFSSLKHKYFRLFWITQAVSLIGSWMYFLTRNWLVLELTDSPFWLGIISGITLSPVIFLSLPAGVLADRIDKRYLLIITQIAAMVLAFVITYLTYNDLVTINHVLIISLCFGIVNAVEGPSRQSYIVELVGRKDLLNAIALNSSIFNGARMLGPAIAGVLISFVGISGVFLINAISFVGVVIALFFIKSEFKVREKKNSAFQDFVEGFKYIWNHKLVFNLMLIVATFSLFGMSYAVLLPYFAKHILNGGSRELGYLMGVNGIGALLGALGLAAFSHIEKRGRWVLVSAFIFTIGLWFFSFSKNFYFSLIPLPFVGFSMVFLVATANTILQTLVKDNVRGRVMSFFTFMFLGVAPIGSFFAGFLSEYLDVIIIIRIGSALCLFLIVLAFLRTPKLVKEI